jgi:hypothetical protein
MIGKLEKVILKIVQRHTEEGGTLNAKTVGFSARNSTTIRCVRLTDYVTFNSKNNMLWMQYPQISIKGLSHHMANWLVI